MGRKKIREAKIADTSDILNTILGIKFQNITAEAEVLSTAGEGSDLALQLTKRIILPSKTSKFLVRVITYG